MYVSYLIKYILLTVSILVFHEIFFYLIYDMKRNSKSKFIFNTILEFERREFFSQKKNYAKVFI